MEQLLQRNEFILAEAAVVEPLRRSGEVALHPRLLHAPLIYEPRGRQELEAIYRTYIEVAARGGLPILLGTPTWRANRERVEEAGLPNSVNADAVAFMKDLGADRASGGPPVKIGGVIGCRNDCYRPEQGLSAGEAESFHQWQIDQLAEAGADFLIAETLPNAAEASGIARAMAKTGTPYFISFVIDRQGRVLGGADLLDAVHRVDDAAPDAPLGQMVNCAHPSFLRAEEQPVELFDRLLGYLANASSLDHCELDGAELLQADDVAEWGEQMLRFNRRHGVKILGGCCGTGVAHLEYLVDH
jgi:S-methylmethionine-dependent homocysteine/selenocysteine methylase